MKEERKIDESRRGGPKSEKSRRHLWTTDVHGGEVPQGESQYKPK